MTATPTFEPHGALYFPNISNSGMTDEEFAQKLIEEEKVAVVPGSAFGAGGAGFVLLLRGGLRRSSPSPPRPFYARSLMAQDNFCERFFGMREQRSNLILPVAPNYEHPIYGIRSCHWVRSSR
jgi:hypothetical protein